jgi:hypothetical protein
VPQEFLEAIPGAFGASNYRAGHLVERFQPDVVMIIGAGIRVDNVAYKLSMTIRY